MKKGTSRHPKTVHLSVLLEVGRHEAVGVLNDLWEWAGEYAPAGDIGRYTNEQISHGVGYNGEASKLVSALTEAGWLDQVDRFRLLIHDWPDHCEGWVKKRLLRSGQAFVEDYPNGDNGQSSHRPAAVAPVDSKTQKPEDWIGLDRKGRGSMRGKGFEEFWKTYPNKRGGKAKALEIWKRKNLADQADLIIKAVIAQIQWRDGQVSSGAKFVPAWPYGTTWLNQGRWEDDLASDSTGKSLTHSVERADKLIVKTTQSAQAATDSYDSEKQQVDELLSDADLPKLHQQVVESTGRFKDADPEKSWALRSLMARIVKSNED